MKRIAAKKLSVTRVTLRQLSEDALGGVAGGTLGGGLSPKLPGLTGPLDCGSLDGSGTLSRKGTPSLCFPGACDLPGPLGGLGGLGGGIKKP